MDVKEEEILILDADIEEQGGESKIKILVKNRQGERKELFDTSFSYYFYVVPSEDDKVEMLKKEIEELRGESGEKIKKATVEEKIVGLERRKVVKVELSKPSHYLKFKDLIKTLKYYGEKREKDIPYLRLWFWDRGVSPGRWYKIKYVESKRGKEIWRDILSIEELEDAKENDFNMMAFDIEVIQEGEEDKIIMISYVTSKGARGVISYRNTRFKDAIVVRDEREMIKRFFELIAEEDVDILFTYNGDGFDFPMLESRARKYGINMSIGYRGRRVEHKRKGMLTRYLVYGKGHFDIYSFISRILAPTLNAEVLSLDAVAQELLGEGKKDMNWELMESLWKNNGDIERIAEYCLRDSELTLKLGMLLLPNVLSLADITKYLIHEIAGATYGNLVEAYAIRNSKKMGYLVPNKPVKADIEQRYALGEFEGAFVVEPKPGLYENIAVFDFRSLYSSIIITHNIDPYTLTTSCSSLPKVPGKDYCFIQDKKGFIPQAINHLLSKRIETKRRAREAEGIKKKWLKAKDYALKTILNSFYGYLGFIGSRWYKRECAEAVTAYGRYYIKKIINEVEKRGYKVIYGDTDSVFIKIDKEESKRVLRELNEMLPGVIELEYQGYYRRGLFVSKKDRVRGAKKRYALIDEKGNLTIRGFEKVRRDWSNLAKKTQEVVLRKILEGDVKGAKEYVREVIEKLKRKEVKKEDLIIYTQLQKNVDNYEQQAPHVVVAKKAIQKGIKIYKGMTLPYIITSKPGSIAEKAELASFVKEGEYDVDYYIHNQVLPAAMRAFSALGVEEKELQGMGKQQRLF